MLDKLHLPTLVTALIAIVIVVVLYHLIFRK